MGIGVFDVAAAGDDEQRLASRALQDKVAAATYDVRERHGQWLFGAHDYDGFNDRAKLAYVDICKTIEPHLHARKGIYRKVMKTLEREWRQRQAAQTEDTMAQVADQSVAGSQAGRGIPKPPAPIKMHTHQPQLVGKIACWPGCHENEAHAKKFHKDKDDDKKESRRHEAVQPHDPSFVNEHGEHIHYDPQSESHHPFYSEGPVEDHYATRRQAGPPVSQDPDRAHRVTDQTHQKVDEHAQKNHQVLDQLHQKIDERALGTQGLLGAGEGPRGPVGGFGGPDPYGDPMGGHAPIQFEPDPQQDLYMQIPDGPHRHEDMWSPQEIQQLKMRQGRVAAEDGAYERHAPDHPELDTDVTYHEHQGEELNPEGNFDSYLDRVDQGAPEKVDHDFVSPDSRNTSVSEVTRHDDNGDHNFVPTVTGARVYSEYQRIARMLQGGPGMDPSMAAPGGPSIPDTSTPGAGASGVASAAPNVGPTAPSASTSTPPAGAGPAQPMMPMASREFQRISAMLRTSAPTSPVQPMGGPNTPVVDIIKSLGDPAEVQPIGGLPNAHTGSRKYADSNYLQKADEALTKVLNEKAEEFQNTIAPLQQALITIQQAEQMANPLNVSPPAGTVNVMPGQQQGGAAQAASGGGVGLGADPAAAGLAGQPATQAMQQTANRRRPKKA